MTLANGLGGGGGGGSVGGVLAADPLPCLGGCVDRNYHILQMVQELFIDSRLGADLQGGQLLTTSPKEKALPPQLMILVCCPMD